MCTDLTKDAFQKFHLQLTDVNTHVE